MNKTRLSPLWVTFLAATAVLGLSQAAQGQAPNAAPGKTDEASATTPTPLASQSPASQSPAELSDTPASLEAAPTAAPTNTEAATVVEPGPELSPSDLLQVTPVFAQADPGQETPDRLRVDPFAPAQPTTPTVPPTDPAPEAPTPTEEETPTTPTPTTPDSAPSTPTPTTEAETRVLVGEVVIQGVDGELQQEVYRAIETRPGRTTTRSQLQKDINAIFATGYFSNVRAVPEDTPLGVRVTFEVALNPVLQEVKVEGNSVLPTDIVTQTFQPQYGKVLNLNELQEGIKVINKWYQDNGYVLGQVLDSPAVSPEGIVTLQVAEGEVEALKVRYLNKEGNECLRNDQGRFVLVDAESKEPVLDSKGNPSGCRNRTREFIVTREFETKPGDIFNRRKVEQDIQRVFGLGIFEDVRLALEPSPTDPRKVVVVPTIIEKNAGSIFASAGISSASGLFGSVGYQQQNLGGNNQKLAAEVQVGQRELLFDLSFTDPWIGGDPFRTSYTVNVFRRRTISLIFDGGERDVDLPNGDTPRILRTGGILSFTRPLSRDVFRRSEWTASLGLQYQRVSIRDRDGELNPVDQFGNDLSFSGTGRDDLLSLQFGVVQDRRNDPLRPTRGSLLRLGTEQFLPVGSGSILGNRLRASYSYYLPTQLLKFTKGCQAPNPRSADCPQTFAFNVQGGTVFGDLPPYEAFSLGGSNSVRGYDEGELSASRTYVQATAEYRFPIFSIFSGALFVDGAYNFGTQGLVPGSPGIIREKPGSGFGYGLGVRVQSPLGPIRIDYGINDQGDSRIHFGIGERF